MTKSLSKAIALATLMGAAASAQAAPTDVVVNPNGLGEVLLYSLYTAEEGNITNINITNTTNFTKAVKVRFVEGQNSQEVLDFNLYLSPRDQWSGAVTATADGAMLISADKSCTVPAITPTGVAFKDLDYIGDGGEQSLARTRVGHLEVIEMGTVTNATMAAAMKAGSAPGLAPNNCGVVTNAFGKDGLWETNVLRGISGNNAGGLYGSASILNIDGSTQISYDAVAIENFKMPGTAGRLHARPGTIYPTLNGAIFKGDTAVQRTRVKGVWAAVPTALNTSTVGSLTQELARNEINNDFVLDEARGSQTNWVVTYPTKRFHVDMNMDDSLASYKEAVLLAALDAAQATFDAIATPTPAEKKALEAAKKAYADGLLTIPAPFGQLWNTVVAPGKSCDAININAWDNEEYVQTNVEFSPSRPGNGPQLCYETNILTFNGTKVLGGEFVTENIELAQPDFQFGWMNIDFGTVAVPAKALPAIGFSAVTVKNNNTANGLNNNYGSATNHKTK